MAKGYNENQERLQLVSSFGKDLARRAKSKCEISGESGVSLVIYELEPVKSEPDFDRCVLISQDVAEQLAKPKGIDPAQWRGLGEQIWSEIPAVQMLAVRMLLFIAKSEPWAQEALDNAYLEDELMAMAEENLLN